MKVYISGDIEGITGTTNWNETEKNLPDWEQFAKQMTKEVSAAAKGALLAGADKIIIKDAHDSGRNINMDELPEEVELIRGWTGDPLSMMAGIDETFDAAIFIGYHNGADTISNPLSHTMSTSEVLNVKLNGECISEFILNAYAAALFDVPVVFVSGDKGLIEKVKEVNSNIVTLGVKDGVGGATINMHPKKAVKETEELVKKSLSEGVESKKIKLPERFDLEIEYKDHKSAYRYSFYPGAEYKSPRTVIFKTEKYYEILRIIHFLT